ncbi:unnamed protein product [Lathyrus oleraceus]
MKNIVDSNLFKGLKVNEEFSYNIIQFTNDTLLVGESNWTNLWCIRVLLRGFKIVSGLRVNFFKSSICGVNLNLEFLEAASVFLHRGVCPLPFKFMGILVEDSMRKTEMWKYVIDNLRRRFAVWRGKSLSISGIVVLINWVLNAMLIFTLSSYKAPLVIIKEIVKIQSNFIWGRILNS